MLEGGVDQRPDAMNRGDLGLIALVHREVRERADHPRLHLDVAHVDTRGFDQGVDTALVRVRVRVRARARARTRVREGLGLALNLN